MVKYESDKVFAALGHPVRRAIAEQLMRNGTMPLSELARPFSMSLPAVMKHVVVLEESGVVLSSKNGRVRYCALNPEALQAGMGWLREAERLWEGRFERLERHLNSTKHS